MNRIVYRDRPAEVLYVGVVGIWGLIVSAMILTTDQWMFVVFPVLLMVWVVLVVRRTFVAVDDDSVVVSTAFGKTEVAIADITGIQHRRSFLNFRATYRIDAGSRTILLPPPFTLKRYLVNAVQDITQRIAASQ